MLRARPIPIYVALAAVTIGAGLASRRYPDAFPAFIARYAGDTLWAATVFWILALARRRARAQTLAVVALAVSFAVEFSQLYHASWIDSIRRTSLGALLLGSGFLWSDLFCYAVGVSTAAVMDLWIARGVNSPGRG